MVRVNGYKDMPCVLMTKLNSYFGVVLAGGKSSRMGKDKTQLCFRGRTLLDHAIELLKETLKFLKEDYSQIFLSGNINHPCSIPDSYVDLGPLGGVLSVLDHLSEYSCDSHTPQKVLFIPVDMPALNSQILLELVSIQGTFQSIQFERHELPFVMNNDAFVRKMIKQLLMSEQRSLYQLHSKLESCKVPLSSAQEIHLININFPDDWSQFNCLENGLF